MINRLISRHKFISCLLAVVVAMWVVYFAFGHRIVSAIYEGTAPQFLSQTIERPAQHSLDYYEHKAGRNFLKWNVLFFLIFLFSFAPFLKGKRVRFLFVFITYLLVAFFVLNIFFWKWGFKIDNARNSLEQVLTLTAHRPFVYRLLMPLGINAVTGIFPQDYVNRQGNFLKKSSFLSRYDHLKDLSGKRIFQTHVIYVVLFLLLFLLQWAVRRVTRLVYPDIPVVFSDIAPAIAVFLLPLTFFRGGYLYDFPELFLMAVLMICLLKKRWMAYYAVFVLAVLNKESNVLLVLFFLAFQLGKMPKKSLWGHCLRHVLIGGFLLAGSRLLFMSHPGSSVENHLVENIVFWTSLKSYFTFGDPYNLGFSFFPRGGNILTLIVPGFLVFYGWSRKPIEIKRLFLYMAAALFPLTLFFGFKDEIRNLALIFPAIYLLAIYTIFQWYQTAYGKGQRA